MSGGLINRILTSSSDYGTGNRAVVFLQGCSFNCLYCCTPETISQCVSCGRCIDSCITGALTIGDDGLEFDESLCNDCDECLLACNKNSYPKALTMTVEQVMQKIIPIRDSISGITVSGGECSLQIEFITELFKAAKNLGLHTLIDSNGSRFYGDLPEFMAVCDGVMLDVKAFDLAEHKKLTGKDNQTVLRNLDYLLTSKKLHEVETVIVPELLNNEQTVDQISKIIAKADNNVCYKLIKFRAHGVRQNLMSAISPSDEYMNSLVAIAKANGVLNVVLA